MDLLWSSPHLESHFEYRPAKGDKGSTTIVLIHGIGLDMTTWDFVWNRFGDTYGVLRYNVPGHGGREFSDLSSIVEFAEDLHSLLTYLHIDTIHIVGQSMGANIGLLFSAIHPTRVSTLTAISCHMSFPTSVSNDMEQYRRELVQDDTLQRVSSLLIPRICMDPDGQSGHILSLAYSKISPSTYFSILNHRSIDEYNSVMQANEKTALPILHLAGEHDGICSPYVYGISTSTFSNSRFVILPHASNAVQLDAPEIFTKLALEFIDHHEKSASTSSRNPTLHEVSLSDLIPKPNHSSELNIHLLNYFQVAINDVPVSGGWNKRLARQILAYLVFNPSVTRDRLSEQFWPDSDPQQARNNLRVSLHHLKKLLGPEEQFLKVERYSVRFAGKVQCDVIDLLYDLQSIANEPISDKKAAMIEKLIPTFTPHCLAMYDELWFLTVRSKANMGVTIATIWLGEYYFDLGQYLSAIHAWEYCLQFNEYDLPLYDRIIEAAERLQSHAERSEWEKRRNEKVFELGR